MTLRSSCSILITVVWESTSSMKVSTRFFASIHMCFSGRECSCLYVSCIVRWQMRLNVVVSIACPPNAPINEFIISCAAHTRILLWCEEAMRNTKWLKIEAQQIHHNIMNWRNNRNHIDIGAGWWANEMQCYELWSHDEMWQWQTQWTLSICRRMHLWRTVVGGCTQAPLCCLQSVVHCTLRNEYDSLSRDQILSLDFKPIRFELAVHFPLY